MTFRELLEKYKNGSATPEEREQTERELEKFDALTEYMLEQDFPQEEQPKAEAAEGELKKIRRNIKQRNAVLVCLAAGLRRRAILNLPSASGCGMTRRKCIILIRRISLLKRLTAILPLFRSLRCRKYAWTAYMSGSRAGEGMT